MRLALGLALALCSAVALNWGFVAQHHAASALPDLSLRRPLRSLRLLFRDLHWFAGFAVGLAGWAFYVAALVLAPLSLVQAVAAGGVALLAGFARARGAVLQRLQMVAVSVAVLGLLALAFSLGGGASSGGHASWAGILGWVAISAFAATVLGRFGAGLGLASGVLYAAGDVATKGAVAGGGRLLLVPAVLLAHGAAFALLQLAFQRGGALASAGTSTLLTNALPIVAGIVLFHEPLPGGALGALRITAFALVVAAAALLSLSGDGTGREHATVTQPAGGRSPELHARDDEVAHAI